MSTLQPRRIPIGARLRSARVCGALACASLTLALGCSRRGSTAPASGPVEVGVVTIDPRPVTLTTELPGRVSAFRVAEVRARVNGIVLRRSFTEGSEVKQGQVLFQIDPTPYRVALDGAVAQLARAEARLASARITATRTAVLLAGDATSQQSNDDAVAALKAADADVVASRAAVDAARINLGYTSVTAPVSGRIGRSEVTEGAYVQAATATRLAVIQQLDPVYVDVTQSSADLLRLRRALGSGKLRSADDRARVSLVSEDGHEYERPGSLQFTDVTVDPGTGAVVLRVVFPNPQSELLPGMYVRARLAEGVSQEALLVPQSAVTRDSRGQPTALVVKEGKAELRTLATERAIGDAWLVTDGVQPGEQVIVEGLQKVRPGAPVTAAPAGKPSAGPPGGPANARGAAATAK